MSRLPPTVRDYKRLTQDPPGGISGAPCADNIMVWNAVIFGPGKRMCSAEHTASAPRVESSTQ